MLDQPSLLSTLCPASIVLGRRSVRFTEATTEADLEAFENLIVEAGDVSPFAFGDYLNHLAATRGDEHARMRAATRFAPQTARQMQWVCRHVDPSRRRDGLTFGHHAEVAKLTPTDQEIMLAKAEENEWPVKQLRAAVRQSQQTIGDGGQKPGDSRAAAGSRAFEEFSAWFLTQFPEMSGAMQDAWAKDLRPLVSMVLESMDDEERAAYLGSGEYAGSNPE